MRCGLALAWLLPLAAGCPAFTTMGPARTVPAGSTQAWLSLGAYQTTLVTGTAPGPVERSREWLPLFEGGARFGLADRWDLTFRGGTGGASIAPRLQLGRSPDPNTGLDFLLEGSVGYTSLLAGSRDDVVSGVTFGAALPVGWNLGAGHQLVATPRIAWMANGVLGGAVLSGGSLPMVLLLTTGARGPWYLVPECGVASVSGGNAFEGPVVQCVLGLIGPR